MISRHNIQGEFGLLRIFRGNLHRRSVCCVITQHNASNSSKKLKTSGRGFELLIAVKKKVRTRGITECQTFFICSAKRVICSSKIFERLSTDPETFFITAFSKKFIFSKLHSPPKNPVAAAAACNSVGKTV